MIVPNPNNWFYCTGCQSLSYRFTCCGNSICSGGGCDICAKQFHRGEYQNILDIMAEFEDLDEEQVISVLKAGKSFS
jgi:hypothetical protein